MSYSAIYIFLYFIGNKSIPLFCIPSAPDARRTPADEGAGHFFIFIGEDCYAAAPSTNFEIFSELDLCHVLFPLSQTICAQCEKDACCDWVGDEGAGHFVKMVHNGIEYGDMQLIGEAYHLMKDVLGLSHREMADTFADWNRGVLDSFLIEITANILRYKVRRLLQIDHVALKHLEIGVGSLKLSKTTW